MARSPFKHYVRNRDNGLVIQNSLVHLYVKGTTTYVSDAFDAESGGNAVTTLTSNSQGEISGWLASPKQIDLLVTDNSSAAYYPATPTTLLSFASITETINVLPPGNELFTTANLEAHEADTTSVHGITDTSLLLAVGGDVVPKSVVDAKGDLIAATAADTVARLAVGSDRQLLSTDSAQSTGLAWVKAPYVLDRTTSDLDIVSSAAETTLYSVTVSANAMSTDRLVQMLIEGDFLNNTGSNQTFVLKVKFGGTTVFEDTTATLATSGIRRITSIEVLLMAVSASAQEGNLKMFFGGAAADPAVGKGSITDTTAVYLGELETGTIDTTSNQDLAVTIALSAASANYSLRRRRARTMLI
jgi:hypothetical protein